MHYLRVTDSQKFMSQKFMFAKIYGLKVVIISALRHYFTLIVYLNPGQGWYFSMVAHARWRKVYLHWNFMELFIKVWPQNIRTCPDYPRCNFNREQVYSVITYILLSWKCFSQVWTLFLDICLLKSASTTLCFCYLT